MASYPGSIFSPRVLVNRAGAVYDALKTKVFFAKDHNDPLAEIVAIENELGINPKGAYASVSAYLDDLSALISEIVIPTKASGSDIDTGTDDAKFVTSKSIKDSHDVPSVAPGDAGNVLTSDGEYWISAAPSVGGFIPSVVLSSCFEKASRFNPTLGGSGAIIYGVFGATYQSGATAGSYVSQKLAMCRNNAYIYSGSPVFTCRCGITNTGANASFNGSAFIGLGTPTVYAPGHIFTGNHVGFKILIVSGVKTLYATQGDGSETASSALATLVNGDELELVVKVNGTTSVDYFFRINGGSWSSPVTLTTNIPTSADKEMQFSLANNNTSYEFDMDFESLSYSR